MPKHMDIAFQFSETYNNIYTKWTLQIFYPQEEAKQYIASLKTNYELCRNGIYHYLCSNDTVSTLDLQLVIDFHDTELLELALQKPQIYNYFSQNHEIVDTSQVIDKLLDYTIQSDYPESTVVLLDYKSQHGLYEEIDKQFVL